MEKNIKGKKQKLEDEIEELEKKVIMYLEVDQKAQASRIKRQIREKELQIELLKYNDLKNELSIYKKIVSNYPGITNEINSMLLDKNKEN